MNRWTCKYRSSWNSLSPCTSEKTFNILFIARCDDIICYKHNWLPWISHRRLHVRTFTLNLWIIRCIHVSFRLLSASARFFTNVYNATKFLSIILARLEDKSSVSYFCFRSVIEGSNLYTGQLFYRGFRSSRSMDTKLILLCIGKSKSTVYKQYILWFRSPFVDRQTDNLEGRCNANENAECTVVHDDSSI